MPLIKETKHTKVWKGRDDQQLKFFHSFIYAFQKMVQYN